MRKKTAAKAPRRRLGQINDTIVPIKDKLLRLWQTST